MATPDGVERAASSMFHGAWMTGLFAMVMLGAYCLVRWCDESGGWLTVWLLTVVWFAFTLLCWNDERAK
jgi:hypothetical protein